MEPGHVSIEPSDLQILSSLHGEDDQDPRIVFEWSILQKLEPIERLLKALTEGPDLPLHFHDEFPPRPANPNICQVNQKGLAYKLVASMSALNDLQRLCPPMHLSPRIQAFYRVCLVPTLQNYRGSKPIEPLINELWLQAHREGHRTPADAFPYSYCNLLQRSSIDRKKAQELFETLTPYYNCLKAVLRSPDLKLAQSNRLNQARRHQKQLSALFEATRKTYPEVVMIYLELSVPAPKEADTADPEGYALLSDTKATFLKRRQHDPLFHGLVSYCWKYRYTRDQGLVCMMVLFFDIQDQPRFHALTQALADYWLSVAPEGSQCWSPSPTARPKSYQYYGWLDCKEKAVKDGFAALARLMGLYGAYVQPRPPKKLHIFGTSKLPGVKSRPKKKSRTGTKNKKNTGNTEAKS